MLNKTLFKFVEGFFKIDFKHHEAPFALWDGYGTYELLSDNDAVTGLSAKDEASLEGVNEVVQVRFYSLNWDLNDRLVDGVAKTDGAILVNVFGFANFQNEAYEGGVQVRKDFSSQENVLYARSDGMTKYVPKPLEKDRVEAILAGAFHGWKEKIALLISKSVASPKMAWRVELR